MMLFGKQAPLGAPSSCITPPNMPTDILTAASVAACQSSAECKMSSHR